MTGKQESQNILDPPIQPEDPQEPTKGAGTNNPDGRAVYTRKIRDFQALPVKEQNESIRETWKSVAMGIALRAKSFSTTCSPKDFGKLYQLVMSGSVSLEKAFPPDKHLQNPQLIVNLFSSLGPRAASIAIPAVPAIEGQVIECTPSVPPISPSLPPPPSDGGNGSTS